jgi:outer membrane lipoprotein LolB
VTLNSSKTGLISAESPEELLEKATGWVAPITHIVDWVQGYPATENAQVAHDSAQRITQIIEDGWTVDFSYNHQATLPNKLILKQQLESGQENRITMVIQNR